MSEIASYIYVKFQREGIHAYPAAGEDPNLEDVSFLAHPHRHIFHFKVTIEVYDDDREIEFIQFKRFCEALYDGGTLHLQNQSCEMMARHLIAVLKEKFPGRYIEVDISEDNENGAVLQFMNE